MYACQRMDNDKQLREYHVPPVSFPIGSCTCYQAVQWTACEQPTANCCRWQNASASSAPHSVTEQLVLLGVSGLQNG